MKLRACLLALCGSIAASSMADWTVTVLHPNNGATDSSAVAGSGSKQAGAVRLAGVLNACVWSGTAASFLNLNPAGYSASQVADMDGTTQGGWAIDGSPHAMKWSGTAASKVDLNPPGKTESYVDGVWGNKQVGQTLVTPDYHASLWSSTAASWVDLNPAGATESEAYAVYGTHQGGYCVISGIYKAGFWSGTAASWVSLHPAGATASFVHALTATTQGGSAQISGVYQASIWSGTASSRINLNPAGSIESNVEGLFESTQVGYAKFGDSFHACIWTGTRDSFVDLHLALPPNYSSSFANRMYSDGVTDSIVGFGINETTQRGEALLWQRPSQSFTFTLNKSTVAGQNSVQGTITLPGTTGTSTVFTTYDNSSLVTTPATVTVPANNLGKNFQITTTAVNSSINVIIYAKRNAVTKSQPLTLAPLVPTALAFTPSQVTGGQSTSCRVVINGVAGPGGRVIAILDNSANATAPSTVTVPAGATQVIFNIATTAVTSLKTVTVTARVSAGEKTGTFKIAP